jgi:hypothetical protein
MVRNVMMILGLGLTVAAFGCDSSSDGNGGSGGTAGNGGMGGEGGTGGSTALMGACTDAADLAMVCMETFGDDYVGPCATTGGGDAAATSTCLQLDPPAGPGLSEGCADCYGAQSECIRDNCVFAGDGVCLPPNQNSPACLDCRDSSGCDAADATCEGDLGAACAG